MTFRADTCGHIAVLPALNEAEFEYLTAFVLSRRHDGRDSPYDVPGNPAAESGGESFDDRRAHNVPAAGQPDLWCPWRPSCSGSCLALDDTEKMSAPVAWLRYLLEHFLAPGALSASTGRADFAAFTYDHRLGRSVALFDTSSGRLSLIRGEGRTISHTVVDGAVLEH